MNDAVRGAGPADVPAIAAIHRDAFPRQRDSETWVRATLAASPRMLVYVLTRGDGIAGYIFWAQKAGIRPAAVVELDQVAVARELRGRGLGERLVRESLALVRGTLAANGQSTKSVLVSTRADNAARRLYEKVLGAKPAATIEGLYSAAEIFMVAPVAGDHQA